MNQATSSPIRKLAAIMFTDIAGFTALSAENEEKALKLLDYQREILQPIVKQFDGEWLKEIGDGLLLSFSSSKNAVFCAIEIQKVTKEIDNLNLRIGIHQGDILAKDGDVFGDDVNIAARLEPFAALGGIVVSDKVQRDISGTPEITTQYIGKPKFKGVKQEVAIYCLISHGLPETDLSLVTAKLEKDVKKLWFNQKIIVTAILILFFAVGGLYTIIDKNQEVPSIGILYMENLGSEDDEFWARGITEDVIIEVASAGMIRVAPMKEILEYAESVLPLSEIAKKLRVKFLLLSSLNNTKNNFKLKTQLIEMASGKTIYAEKWNEPMKEASTITAMLAQKILTSLDLNSQKSDIEPSINAEAYEYFLKSKYLLLNQKDSLDVIIAEEMLSRAIEIDNTFAAPMRSLAFIAFDKHDFEQSKIYLEKALRVSIENKNKFEEGRSLQELGNYYFHMGEYDKALIYHQESLELKELHGDINGTMYSNMATGYTYSALGLKEMALKHFNIALDISNRLDYDDYQLHVEKEINRESSLD